MSDESPRDPSVIQAGSQCPSPRKSAALRRAWLATRAAARGLTLSQLLAPVATGILLTLAFPLKIWDLEIPSPVQGWTAWLAFAPLAFVARSSSPLQLGLLALGAMTLAFTGSIFWVVVAMVEYGGVPLPVSLLALSLLTVFMASFHGLAAGLALRIHLRRGWSFPWTLAATVTSAELLRNYALTGFPWSSPAYSQARFLELVQIADLGGVYGLTFLIVGVGASLGTVLAQVRRRERIRALELPLALGLLGLALGYGQLRVSQVDALYAAAPRFKVAALQGNIPQDQKWDESRIPEILKIYERLTEKAVEQGAELVVWPEAAVPRLVLSSTSTWTETRLPTGASQPLHLLGAPSYDPVQTFGQPLVLRNSAFLVSSEAQVLGRYDKSHLVPFGEYVPLKELLFFLGPIVEAAADFIPGERVVPLSTARLTLGILICYEDIFPEIGRQLGRAGAELFVNITNDAWYGPTSAQQQHLDMAVFRAVESRVAVVRAANTGISAVVDPVGRVLRKTSNWEEALLVTEVGLQTARSPYLRLGDSFALLCALFSVLAPWLPTRSVPPLARA